MKMSKKQISEAARAYMSEIGKRGGKNNKHQSKAAQTYWAKLTPEERSEEMRRRAEKREANRQRKK